MGDRAEKKLSAAKIKAAESGKYQDGGGLILVKKGETGKWVYRFSYLGRRKEMGLGGWPAVSLADARKERDACRRQLQNGDDPIRLRQEARENAKAELDRMDPTVEEAAKAVLESIKATLKGEGQAGRWLSPLRVHVFPKIGAKRLSRLTQYDIAEALKPIWQTKHPTAEKALQRVRIVLHHSRHMGRDCDPAIADNAKYILGAYNHKPQGIAFTPWQDIPALYARLDGGSMAHQCLRLMMLTCVRGNAARGARQSEREGSLWTIAAERMKAREGKAESFRVPLAEPAINIFEAMCITGDDLLFATGKGYLSDARLSQVMTGLKEEGRPHGLRSSFRTWVSDTGACEWEVAETVLSHTIGNATERSYARSDLLDRRRDVMEEWARFVTAS